MVVMAANGNDSQEAFAPVLAAMSTMRDGQREQKQAAHQYLEKFQKSVGDDSFPAYATTPADSYDRQKLGRSPLGSCSLKSMLSTRCLRLQR